MESQISCSTGSCKTSEKIWAIINPSTNKLHRLTFSETLAQLIVKTCPEMEIRRWTYIPGKHLEPYEKSKTGLYGIVSTNKNVVLRISCIQEIAEMYRDESRDICEMYIDVS